MSEKIIKNLPKKEFKKSVKKSGKKIAKKSVKKSSRKIAKKSVKKSTKKVVKKSTKKISKKSVKKSGKKLFKFRITVGELQQKGASYQTNLLQLAQLVSNVQLKSDIVNKGTDAYTKEFASINKDELSDEKLTVYQQNFENLVKEIETDIDFNHIPDLITQINTYMGLVETAYGESEGIPSFQQSFWTLIQQANAYRQELEQISQILNTCKEQLKESASLASSIIERRKQRIIPDVEENPDNNYELIGKLGEGSYGMVKLVRKKSDDHTYVIKEIFPIESDVWSYDGVKIVGNTDYYYGLNELDVLTRLTHPNILHASDFYLYKGKIYVVLPYYPMTLDKSPYLKLNKREKLMKKNSPEVLEMKLKWMRQLISALAFLRQNGLTHCDIKPNNLLLDADNNMVLADFSFVYTLDSNHICGSFEYSSPQGLVNQGYKLHPDDDPEGKYLKLVEEPLRQFDSDMWSLGVVFLYMLIGFNPFKRKSSLLYLDYSEIQKMVKFYAPDPEKFLRDLEVPDVFIPVLVKMMAIDQKQRYQSYEDIILNPIFNPHNTLIPGEISPVFTDNEVCSPKFKYFLGKLREYAIRLDIRLENLALSLSLLYKTYAAYDEYLVNSKVADEYLFSLITISGLLTDDRKAKFKYYREISPELDEKEMLKVERSIIKAMGGRTHLRTFYDEEISQESVIDIINKGLGCDEYVGKGVDRLVMESSRGSSKKYGRASILK